LYASKHVNGRVGLALLGKELVSYLHALIRILIFVVVLATRLLQLLLFAVLLDRREVFKLCQEVGSKRGLAE